MFPQTVYLRRISFYFLLKNMGHSAELMFRFRRVKLHLASLRYSEFFLQKFIVYTTTAA